MNIHFPNGIARTIMKYDLVSLSEPPERARMEALLSEYYELMFDRLRGMDADERDIPQLRAALDDYWAHCTDYLPPKGRTYLALDPDGTWLGCGTLRRVDRTTGELKRLYVRDAARGTGLGRKLVEARLEDARSMGLETLLVDTLKPNVEMRALYAKLGFQEVEPFAESSTVSHFGGLLPYMVFYRLNLNR